MFIYCLLPLAVEAEEKSRLIGAVANPFDEVTAGSSAKGNDGSFWYPAETNFGGNGLKEWSLRLLGQHIFHTLFVQNVPWNGKTS